MASLSQLLRPYRHSDEPRETPKKGCFIALLLTGGLPAAILLSMGWWLYNAFS